MTVVASAMITRANDAANAPSSVVGGFKKCCFVR
jgi:hypothetical protein